MKWGFVCSNEGVVSVCHDEGEEPKDKAISSLVYLFTLSTFILYLIYFNHTDSRIESR